MHPIIKNSFLILIPIVVIGFVSMIDSANTLYLLFLGFFLFFSFYNFLIYVESKNIIFFYYALYIFAFSLYLMPKAVFIREATKDSGLLCDFIYNFNKFIQPIIYIFYFQFTRMFLETKLKYPKLDRLLMKIIYASLAISILLFGSHFIHLEFSNFIYDAYRVGLIFIVIYLFLSKVNWKEGANRYYFIGAMLLFVFTVTAFITSIFEVTFWVIHPLHYMAAGVCLEVMVFSLGLGYKFRIFEQLKFDSQEKLLAKATENEELSKKLNFELQKKIQRSDLENKLMDLESRLLRSQMNPHFLFNSLNSLKRYILEAREEDALVFLDDFSTLFRKILNNSRQRMIPLRQELDALELYIKLEQKRLYNSFDFKKIISPDLDVDFISVPPMLLQPFIENCIWHGIMNKEEGKGEIILSIEESTKSIKYKIEDNGVGRRKAAQLKKRKNNTHPSLGNKLIKDRIDLLKEIDKHHISFEFIDKPLDGGTIVILEQNFK